MFIYIPGEIISLLTFPGVILHEIAHRFFCDIFNVPVYAISYFRPFSKEAGHVILAKQSKITPAFFIAIGPLIINSLACMLLTFPFAMMQTLGTSFALEWSPYPFLLNPTNFAAWLGYSIGLHAIPSNQDLEPLKRIPEEGAKKESAILLSALLWIFNVKYIGSMLTLLYTIAISFILPKIVLGFLS